MKTRALLIVGVFVVVSVGIYLSAQNRNTVTSGTEAYPFEYDKKIFGDVRVRKEKRIVSSDESVKTGWPVDAPEHKCYDLERNQALPAFEKGRGIFIRPIVSFVSFLPRIRLPISPPIRIFPKLSAS